MNDDDIAKLANQLTQSLATKEDIEILKTELKTDLKELDLKADAILRYADALEESVSDLDKRVTRIEVVPSIAHDINK